MCSRSEIVSVSPAPYSAMLEAGRNSAYLRRVLQLQRRKCQTIAYYDGAGELLAIAMLYAWRAKRVELAMSIQRASRPHMMQLVKTAHLTLARIVDAGILVFARVHPMNRAGQRMARLCGFRRAKLKDQAIWIRSGR